MSWLTEEELKAFKKVGKNVLISRDAIFYGKENIQIGSNVRIDTACIFLCAKGSLNIGDYVHIAVRSTFLCLGGITIFDHAQIASHCLILSASDDFSGEFLIGPTVPIEHRNVYVADVFIGKCCVIGANCVISPGTQMPMGSALGAMSMTKKDQHLIANTIHIGIPAKPIKKRSERMHELVREIEKDNHRSELQSRKPSTDNSQS